MTLRWTWEWIIWICASGMDQDLLGGSLWVYGGSDHMWLWLLLMLIHCCALESCAMHSVCALCSYTRWSLPWKARANKITRIITIVVRLWPHFSNFFLHFPSVQSILQIFFRNCLKMSPRRSFYETYMAEIPVLRHPCFCGSVKVKLGLLMLHIVLSIPGHCIQVDMAKKTILANWLQCE